MLKRKKPKKSSRLKNLKTSRNHFVCELLFLWISVFIFANHTSAQSTEYPFKSGEYAKYGAYYNWHFIWIQSGEVEFSADTLQYHNQKAWHLKALGKSLKAYDLLYTVRDTFETFSNYNSFRPIFSRRAMNHAKDYSIHQYWFDNPPGKIKAQVNEKGKPVFYGRIPFEANTLDILSTAFNFRKFDFNKLFIGQKVPYRMVIDKQNADLFFRYLGKEKVKTRTGHEYQCHKVSVYLLQGDFFREGEYMKIWFTDDKNHLPVQVETEIMIGTVKALLLETKSLKYPITSKIK
jgi:hypothetical protein